MYKSPANIAEILSEILEYNRESDLYNIYLDTAFFHLLDIALNIKTDTNLMMYHTFEGLTRFSGLITAPSGRVRITNNYALMELAAEFMTESEMEQFDCFDNVIIQSVVFNLCRGEVIDQRIFKKDVIEYEYECSPQEIECEINKLAIQSEQYVSELKHRNKFQKLFRRKK